MDYKQLIAWLVPIVARGAAWILASWLGFEATQATDLGTQIASIVGAALLVGVAIYTSLKGRKKLLMQQPPSS